MNMIAAIETIQTNLGMVIELVFVLILFIAGTILLARSFLIGAMINFMVWAVVFVLFYLNNLNWTFPLILMFMHIVILSLGFIAVKMSKSQGYY